MPLNSILSIALLLNILGPSALAGMLGIKLYIVAFFFFLKMFVL